MHHPCLGKTRLKSNRSNWLDYTVISVGECFGGDTCPPFNNKVTKMFKRCVLYLRAQGPSRFSPKSCICISHLYNTEPSWCKPYVNSSSSTVVQYYNSNVLECSLNVWPQVSNILFLKVATSPAGLQLYNGMLNKHIRVWWSSVHILFGQMALSSLIVKINICAKVDLYMQTDWVYGLYDKLKILQHSRFF